jgi:single-strand DNA-binding protein
MDINKIIIIGRLTRDPEVRQAGEKSVTAFSIANNYGKDKAYFFDVEAWDKTGELVAQYCKKGKQVAIEGTLIQQSWEKDGQKLSKLKIRAYQVQFLGGDTAEKVEKVFADNPFNDDDINF